MTVPELRNVTITDEEIDALKRSIHYLVDHAHILKSTHLLGSFYAVNDSTSRLREFLAREAPGNAYESL